MYIKEHVGTSSVEKKKDNVKYNEYSLPGRNNYLWEENIQQLISSDSSSSTLLLGMEFFKESMNCSNSIIIIYLFIINSIPTNRFRSISPSQPSFPLFAMHNIVLKIS